MRFSKGVGHHSGIPLIIMSGKEAYRSTTLFTEIKESALANITLI